MFPFHLLWLNLILVVVITAVCAALARKGSRAEVAMPVAAGLLSLSWTGWLIYVVLHFLNMYW